MRPSLHYLRAWLNSQIAVLDPGCFALVMATGIISNAMFFEGRREWSDALFVANLIVYPWLVLLTMWRLAQFSKRLWADLTNPHIVFSFFTIVAATDVFAVGFSLRGLESVALVMWLCSLILWLALIYFSFGVLILLNASHGANVVYGGWLNAIVGTESLVILGAIVAPTLRDLNPTAFVLVHMLWGIGLGLYAIFTTLFAYRIFFFDIEPNDVTPVLWVVMGAAAISTNAGSTLIFSESGMPFLNSMRSFIEGVTLIMWAWATWWIPLLLLLGLWKHGICRVPLTYTPMLWSLVFPLGMYALASLRLSLTANFPPLQYVSLAMVWIAFGAWIATGTGLVVSSWRSFVRYVRSRDAQRT